MDLLQTEEVASTVLFHLRLSDSELQYLAIALEYVLMHLDEKQLHQEFDEGDEQVQPSDTREFLEDRWQELVCLIQEYGDPALLDARFWNRTDLRE